MNSNLNYINVLDDSDPIKHFLDKLCLCTNVNRKTFIARLIEVKNGELWFEDRNGRLSMNRRDCIASIIPLKEEAV